MFFQELLAHKLIIPVFLKINAEISLITPVKTGFGTANLTAIISSTMIVVCAIISIVFLPIGYACGWFSQKHKQSRSRKAASESSVEENTEGSQLPPTLGPLSLLEAVCLRIVENVFEICVMQ